MNRILLRGARVITMAPGRPDAERLDILVEGEHILALGEGLDSVGAEIVDVAGRIVIPGMVNAHVHTWQTGIRGVGADWTLLEYLAEIHGGIARRYSPTDMRIGTLVGALNQINSGVTTVGDWCHNCRTPEHADAAIEGLHHAGIRAVFFHGASHGIGDKPHNMREVDRLLAGPLANGDLITGGMAVKGPQLSSAEVALADLRAGAERGVMITMHQSVGTAGPGWKLAADAGLWGPHTNIAHGTGLGGDLLKTLVAAGATFTSTPENELAQGHCTAITEELLAIGAAPSLGTDTEIAVSGEILSAARITLARQRSLAHIRANRDTGLSAPEVHPTGKQALGWVTTEGARALGMADRIGRIEPGMQADLVLIDTRAINLWPAHNPIAAALHANTANIEAVIIAGRWRKRDYVLTDTDLAAVTAELGQSGGRLVRGIHDNGVVARTRRRVVRRVVHRNMHHQASLGGDGPPASA